jgi:hypothetical protein
MFCQPLAGYRYRIVLRQRTLERQCWIVRNSPLISVPLARQPTDKKAIRRNDA